MKRKKQDLSRVSPITNVIESITQLVVLVDLIILIT